MSIRNHPRRREIARLILVGVALKAAMVVVAMILIANMQQAATAPL